MKHLILPFLILFVLDVSAQTKITYTYAIKGVDTLKLDVYTPRIINKTETLPVLLWMHGGGFAGGTKDNKDEQELCEYAANNGYISVSISYRLLRKGTETGFGCDCPKQDKLNTFKQASIDYLDAANYIVNNSEKLRIDTTKIIAGGSSAGAEAILNAVYMKEYFVEDLSSYDRIDFAGVFSLAGAVVNADYITNENALPTALFHGTDDNLVPFGTAPHHYCDPSKPGYIILDGSETISKKLDELGASYYFYKVIGGKHELSSIPFDQLNAVFSFFDKTILNSEIIQTKIITTMKP
jgi:acetyl esterase/lipase